MNMTKEDILNNVPHLSAEELHGFIKQGIVTKLELMATRQLTPDKRREIDDLQRAEIARDDATWQTAQAGNFIPAYRQYPSGKHTAEANSAINALQMRIDEAQAILNQLENDPNAFTPGMIMEYINDGQLSWGNLQSRFDSAIVRRLQNYNPVTLALGQTPNTIENGYTEVYFWGIPGSGKTCALSAILSTAYEQGVLQKQQGHGFGYMTDLINIFNSSIGILPDPTPVFDKTQYLPFDLKRDSNEKGSRKIALIELSGEIFECFDNYIANTPFRTPDHRETFDILNMYLTGSNRKIHFFFIDYSNDGSLNVKSRAQRDYLDAASLYFQSKKIFKNSTDAIYIITTKSDLMPCQPHDRKSMARQYLETNFAGFVNGLKNVCRQYSINGGKLFFEPFSLGDVYFQKICKIDKESSNRIKDILIERVYPKKNGLWQEIIQTFNE
jgi:hypothetical protein